MWSDADGNAQDRKKENKEENRTGKESSVIKLERNKRRKVTAINEKTYIETEYFLEGEI